MTKVALPRRKDGIYTADAGAPFIIGTAGREANTADYTLGKPEIRAFEKRILSDALNIPRSHLFFLDQEHGDSVVEVRDPADEAAYVFATADAMVTDRKNLCLVIRTADCVPVILVDPGRKCAAAVHSGWKSTEKKISVKAARLMHERYGASYGSIRAFILPAISGKHYQVGPEFAKKFPCSTSQKEDGFYTDLPEEIRLSLVEEGIRDDKICTADICTFERNDLFFSHRCGDAGRNLNFVMIL